MAKVRQFQVPGSRFQVENGGANGPFTWNLKLETWNLELVCRAGGMT
jgi:hypothetical protein